MRVPRGYSTQPGYTRISINIKHDVFKRLVEIAEKEQKPFSIVTEDILRCGLLCLDESDAHEVAA